MARLRREITLDTRHKTLWFSESVASWAARAYCRECKRNWTKENGTNT